MQLPAPEEEALISALVEPVSRLFCPAATVWPDSVESSSFVIRLSSAADFLNFVSAPTHGQGAPYRLAVVRASTPAGIDFDPLVGALLHCSEVWLERPLAIREVEVHAFHGADLGLLFRGEKHAFGVAADEAAPDELHFYSSAEAFERACQAAERRAVLRVSSKRRPKLP